ncbi:hypothetical protein [Granulicoccus sp. GXG6511]|uniref:hypothetical protein n=1 Tax=Granulicoccus sp. GXG6511 TaxID=3381351 RepID=UPI003D7DB4B6
MNRPRRRWLALLAALALLFSGCGGPGGHERWLASQDVVASVSSTELPLRKLGDRRTWHVVATLTPEATIGDMAALVEAWPRRSNGSRLTLVRPLDDGPELVFTAWPQEERTRARWRMFTRLHEAWPQARVRLGEHGPDDGAPIGAAAEVELARCDPWNELERIDVAEVLERKEFVGLKLTCAGAPGGTVRLSYRSAPGRAALAGLRDRARAVLSHLPPGTPWIATADDPGRPLRIEVETADIPSEPSQAVLARQDADLTIVTVDSGRPVEVLVTGGADLRVVARETIGLPAVERLEVDSRQRKVHTWAALDRVRELTPLATGHPDVTWWVTQHEERPANWVRASGAEFAERARQYQALTDSGIAWTSIVLHDNFGRPTLSVEVEDPSDWRPVVEAVRAVRWASDMSVEIGSGYPQVVFTSTSTGPARDAEVANSHVPPSQERHPELIAIIKAWDATAA